MFGEPRLGQGCKPAAIKGNQPQALLPGREHRRSANRADRFAFALGHHREIEIETYIGQARRLATRAFHPQLGFETHARPY